MCLSEPVHSDSLTVSVRPILQPQMTETRSRNEPHLAWNVPMPGAGRGGGETHAHWILRLPAPAIDRVINK